MRTYKLVILGSGSVGKSAITIQFVKGIFVENYDPTIEDCYIKYITFDKNQCSVEILDTAGTEQFTALRDLYLKKGQGFILVYSVSCRISLNDLHEIKEQLEINKESDAVPLILVGNKADLEEDRVVSFEEGVELAKTFKCSFMETSAKSRLNIDEVFYDLIKQIDSLSESEKEIEPKDLKSNNSKLNKMTKYRGKSSFKKCNIL